MTGMKVARPLFFAAGLLLLSTSSFAQLTSQDKRDVLGGIEHVLTTEAFVPGIDLGKWKTFMAARQQDIDASDTSRQFLAVINGALHEFGVSHIMVMRQRHRSQWGGGDELLQQGHQEPSFEEDGVRWLDDQDAYMRLGGFGRNYDPAEVEDWFQSIAGAKSLVLDLRSNPGGEVDKMRHFLGLVIPPETPVGTFVSKSIASAYVSAGKGDGRDSVAIAKWTSHKMKAPKDSTAPFKGRIAVLVDQDSASAAEVVANALRELRHAPVIGTRTAGAVLFSTFEGLPHGFRIQFPVGDYVSVGGTRLEGHPIVPDVPEGSGGNSEIQAALSALKASR